MATKNTNRQQRRKAENPFKKKEQGRKATKKSEEAEKQKGREAEKQKNCKVVEREKKTN